MNTTDLIVALDAPAGRRRLARLAARGGTVGRDVERGVVRILADVRRRGDAALLAYTRRFDGVRTTARGLAVPPEALSAAYEAQPAAVRRDLALAARRIRAFHRRQRSASWEMRDAQGARLGVRVQPLARVGLYVPGGRAAYPSTVLMTAIPARVAGVRSLVVVSPAGPDGHRPVMLAACHIAGVETLYRVGGAQAIAALAYGTRTIAPVDKIVGPGNAWVATAKRLVYGTVDIDSIAGPSEVLFVADTSARPDLVAADMLAQAEHDPVAAAMCVTTSAPLAHRVAAALAAQLAALPRRTTATRALTRFGAIFVAPTRAAVLDLVNRLAPEHLGLMVRQPRTWLARVRHAGAIFVGGAPEAFGDYVAGPNHVLPTGGTARFASPLGVWDFEKRSTIIEVGSSTLARLGPAVARLARLEGLEAHARSIERRLAPPNGDH